jgi:hypothetical protein
MKQTPLPHLSHSPFNFRFALYLVQISFFILNFFSSPPFSSTFYFRPQAHPRMPASYLIDWRIMPCLEQFSPTTQITFNITLGIMGGASLTNAAHPNSGLRASLASRTTPNTTPPLPPHHLHLYCASLSAALSYSQVTPALWPSHWRTPCSNAASPIWPKVHLLSTLALTSPPS